MNKNLITVTGGRVTIIGCLFNQMASKEKPPGINVPGGF